MIPWISWLFVDGHFQYLVINRATQILAAYIDDEFVGVLLAEIKGEEKKQQNILQKTYITLIDVIQKNIF